MQVIDGANILQQQVEQLLVVEIIKFILLQDLELLQFSCAGNAARIKFSRLFSSCRWRCIRRWFRYRAGGGGAGGYRESSGQLVRFLYSFSFRSNSFTSNSYKVIQLQLEEVGTGGSPIHLGSNGSGSNSVFSTITSAGGGGGGTS
jgi:hypothetical protein